MKPKIKGDFEYEVMCELVTLVDQGYTVPVARAISAKRGTRVELGAVHTVLRRLEEKGFVKSRMEAGTEERGGKAKRLYTVTGAGSKAMRDRREYAQGLYGLLGSVGEAT